MSMRRRILVLAALLLASLLLIAGVTFATQHRTFAAYFTPAPHSCGGG
jgi:hypothetical protein